MKTKQTTTLAKLSGIGSVDEDENGAITLSFMNISIKMCTNRMLVLAAMLKEAATVFARKEMEIRNRRCTAVEPAPESDKNVLN
jgi:hypothetical protein